MRTLLRNLLRVVRSTTPRADYLTAIKELRQAMRKYPNLAKDREQARLYRRAMRHLAKHPIGPINRLNCWFQSWQSKPGSR
jgi:hypothetical protein